MIPIRISLVGADAFDTLPIQREINGHRFLFDCPQCINKKEQANKSSMTAGIHQVEKDIDIIVTYTDTSGAIRSNTIKSKDLSPSWVRKNPIDDNQVQDESKLDTLKDQPDTRIEDSGKIFAEVNKQLHTPSFPVHPIKLGRHIITNSLSDCYHQFPL